MGCHEGLVKKWDKGVGRKGRPPTHRLAGGRPRLGSIKADYFRLDQFLSAFKRLRLKRCKPRWSD